jgi:hypothetical protein
MVEDMSDQRPGHHPANSAAQPSGYGPRDRLQLRESIKLRLTSPAAVVNTVPFLFGFHPTASLVVLGLFRSPGVAGSMLHYALRMDVDPLDEYAAEVGRDLGFRLRTSGCDTAVTLVYPALGARPGDYLRSTATLNAQLRLSGSRVVDALYVANGRWWSLSCHNPRCCPPDGVPITAEQAVEAGAVAAFRGIVVHEDRAALADALKPYSGQLGQDAWTALRQRADRRPLPPAVSCQLADRLLDAVVDGRSSPEPNDAADLLIALLDPAVRDHLACWAGDERVDAMLTLTIELARRAVLPEYRPAPYTLAAWAAWALGRGALVHIALDQALAADPRYPFALLLREAVNRGVPPDLVRDAARKTAAKLAESDPTVWERPA